MPKLFETTEGYYLVTYDKRLFFIFETSKGFCSQLKGIVGDNFKGGRLVKCIPSKLKTTFFKLNKQP